MHIHQIKLQHFGNTAPLDLDLGPGGSLQIVVGPNEAGKTTLMRAIRGFVRGLLVDDPAPRRLQDARVEALVSLNDTQTWLVRDGKEGAAGPLLLPTGARAPMEVDQAWPAPSQRVYDTLFGIDHDMLRRGGEQLQRSNSGELGELLFATMADTVRIGEARKVNDKLLADTFDPNARVTRKTINGAVVALKKAHEELLDATVTHQDHARLERELRTAEAEVERAEVAFSEANQHVLSLTRLEALLPNLEHLDTNATHQAALRDEGPTPDAAWAESVRSVQAKLRRAQDAGSDHSRRVVELEGQLDALVVDRKLLEHGEAIQQAARQLDGYVRAAQELPTAHSELEGAERARDVALSALDHAPKGGERVSLPSADQLDELQAALGALSRATDRTEDRRKTLDEAREALQDAEEALSGDGAEPAVSEVLTDALATARRALAASQGSAKDAAGLARAGMQLLTEAGAQRLHPRSALELIGQTVPPAIERKLWENRRAQHASALDAAERAVAELDQRIAGQTRELEGAVRQMPGMSREALEALRDTRDAAVRDALAMPGSPQDGVWRSIIEADHAADARFDSAQEVARLEGLRDALAELTAKRPALEDIVMEVQAKSAASETAWAEAARALGLPQVSLDALPDWAAAVEDLKAKARQHLERTAALEDVDDQLAAAVAALRATLDSTSGGTGAPFPEESAQATIERAAAALVTQKRELEAYQGRFAAHHIAKNAAEAAARNVRAAERESEAPRQRWDRARAAFDPDGTVSLPGAAGWVDRLKAGRAAEDRWETANRTAARLDKQVQAFEQQVAPLGDLMSTPLPPKERVELLSRQLQDETNASVQHNTVNKALGEEREALQREADRAQAHTEALEALVGEAGLPDADALDAALDRADRMKAFMTEAEVLSRGLKDDEPEQLRAEIGGRSAADLEADKREVKGRQQEHDEARTAARAALKDAQAAFDAVDGKDEAARAAQEREAQRDTIEEALDTLLLERACALLTDRLTAELSRMGDEGPVQRAGEVFAQLTLGSFQGLKVEQRNEDGTPLRYVSGLRANGERVAPSGMSDGTRDALWLALRVAALEGLVDQGHAAPVVLDDVAVHLDDERTAAMLAVFAQLAERTQVLLFTHHSSVVEAAASAGVPHVVLQMAPRPSDLPPLSLDPPDPDPVAAPTVASPAPARATGQSATPALDMDAVLDVLRLHPNGASKSDLLAAGLVDDDTWNALRQALTSDPRVEVTGAKRGTRYRAKA